MKKSGILLLSTLTAGLLAANASYAATSCPMNEYCNFDLTESGKTAVAYFPFTFGKEYTDIAFSCTINTYSMGETVKSSAKIYGGKNAQLNFKSTKKHNLSVETVGRYVPLTAAYIATKDPTDDALGQVKIDLKKTEKMDNAVVKCSEEYQQET